MAIKAPATHGRDVMPRLRAIPSFTAVWDRRTTFVDGDGVEYHLLCIPDLVKAKKAQRSKDWPVIELLVTIHYRQHASEARDEKKGVSHQNEARWKLPRFGG